MSRLLLALGVLCYGTLADKGCRDGLITEDIKISGIVPAENRRRLDIETSKGPSKSWCKTLPENFCTFPELRKKCCKCGGGIHWETDEENDVVVSVGAAK